MHPPLEDLIVAFLERLESDGADDETLLDQLAAEHPDQADPLRERVRSLRRLGLLQSAQRASERGFPERLGDFDLERRLGGGGMGVVYRARQRSMRRRVALKLVRPGHLHFPGTRARFQREAEAAARLSHPNIVPVHLVGEEEGVPYLAMEYVRGASLDRVLRAVAGRAPTELGGRDLRDAVAAALAEEEPAEPRDGVQEEDWDEALFSGAWHEVCLRICRDVARALAHAHERGVLHRDVKPSNVMVTPGGRVLLLDFGLASLSGADAMTRTGAVLGSLPYMSPEQVDGDHRAVDRRADVYGLGVTLYELLTLRSPFLDPDSTERTRARILNGLPAPPRRACASLPRDAQTVCLIAMDRDAGRRFPDASSFADDLERVLQHRPIRVRPVGGATHLWRWAQRHPGAATAAVLALVIAIAGPWLYALQSLRARDRLRAELDRADRNYQRSLDALDLVTRVAAKELADVPMAEAGRRKVLEGVIAFFRQAAEEPGSSPEVTLDRARAQLQLGDLAFALGELDQSSEALRAALATFSAAGVGARSPRAADLARAHWYLARVHERRGLLGDATEELAQALELTPGGAPGSPEGLQRARLRAEHARLQRRAGEREAARAAYRALLDELDVPALAEQSDAAELAAWCYSELSDLDSAAGREPERLASLERALAIREGLVARDPGTRGTRQRLVIDLSNLGGAYLRSRDSERGLPLLERAAELGEALVEDFPGFPAYRYNLSGVLINLGGAYVQDDDLAHGRTCMQRAAELARRLVQLDPEVQDYRAHLLVATSNIAALDLEAGRFEQALAGLDELDATVDELLQRRPGEQTLVRTRFGNALSRARAHLGLGQIEAACSSADRLLEDEDGGTLLEAAAVFAGALGAGGASGGSREELTRATLDLLERALDRGASLEDVLGRESFQVLRDEPRFQALAAE